MTACRPSATSRHRYGCSLITIRRALERARPRGAARADAWPRHVRPRTADRPSTSPARSASPRRCRPAASTPRRGWSRRDPRRPARPSPRRSELELGSPTLYLERLRLGRWRAAAAGAGPPARRAVPGPARLGPRARLAVRPADRALRRPGRAGPRGARTGPAARARGAPAGPPARIACAAHRGHRLDRGRDADRIRPDVRPGRSDALLRGTGRRPPALDAAGGRRGGGTHP